MDEQKGQTCSLFIVGMWLAGFLLGGPLAWLIILFFTWVLLREMGEPR